MKKVGCAMVCFAMLTMSGRAQVPESPADDGANDAPRASTPPRLIHADPVTYPSDASLARTRHTCVISVVIGRDGTLRSAQLENSQSSAFDTPALESVRRATFSPATRNGQAVGARTQVWVEFRGDGQPTIPTMNPGSAFLHPVPQFTPEAKYTDAARRARIRGSVLLSFIVTESGEVAGILVLRRLGGGLDDEAVKTVQKWRFAPATLDGEPVPDRIKTTMSFNLR
jgi:TonB family protein